jgi:RNA polymerase sigma-70 factor (ECF subfamily)
MPGSLKESNTVVALSTADVCLSNSPSSIERDVVELFDQWREPLVRYLSGFSLGVPDSEDIVQETFLALYQHLWRGKSRHNLRGWLFRVAHNLALKKRQRLRRDLLNAPQSTIPVEASSIDPAPNPEDQLAASQTQKLLLAVVRALPEQNRWCLYLRAEGLRYREIAEVLDMSLGAVSLCLERSLAHIARAAER